MQVFTLRILFGKIYPSQTKLQKRNEPNEPSTELMKIKQKSDPKFKDTLFRTLFGEKERAIEFCNAVAGTNYTRDAAIKKAIQKCIDEDILVDFLKENFEEVANMLLWELSFPFAATLSVNGHGTF